MRQKLRRVGCLGLILLGFIFVLTMWPLGRGTLLWVYLEYEFWSAKEIRIVVHSNQSDDRSWLQRWSDPKWLKNPQPYKEKILKTVVLDPSQRSKLEASVFPSSDSSLFEIVKCFDPHHRIEIEHGDGTVTTVEICFECGNLAVGQGRDRLMPSGWPDSVSAFFSSLGLNPKGPFE